jgi:hypothetical protein
MLKKLKEPILLLSIKFWITAILEIKVILFVCLVTHYALKIYGGSGGIDPPFLALVLDEAASGQDRSLKNWKTSPDTH